MDEISEMMFFSHLGVAFSRRTQNIPLGRASVIKPSKVTFASLGFFFSPIFFLSYIFLLFFYFYFQNRKFEIWVL